MSDNKKAETPYSLGRLILYYTRDNFILVAKVSSVGRNILGLQYWYHDLRRWGSLFEALSCAIPLTESLEDELEDLKEDIGLASNPDFIKAMRKLNGENRAYSLTGKTPDSKSGDLGSSPNGLEDCPCGFVCELYDGRVYPGRVIHCPVSHLLSDPDWRAWLEENEDTIRVNNPISPYMRGVKSDCPTASEFELKKPKKSQTFETVVENDQNHGSISQVVWLPDENKVFKADDRVKVTLELLEG